MKKRIISFASLLLLICILTLTVLANIVDYSIDLPSLGHKDVTSGSKTLGSNTYGINENQSTIDYVCWLDAYMNGSWVLVSNNYRANKGSTNMNYTNASIATGTGMRLRTQPGSNSGGWSIYGYMNFR